jgi:hypothetical protein
MKRSYHRKGKKHANGSQLTIWLLSNSACTSCVSRRGKNEAIPRWTVIS